LMNLTMASERQTSTDERSRSRSRKSHPSSTSAQRF
jgi:hypothetical protein